MSLPNQSLVSEIEATRWLRTAQILPVTGTLLEVHTAAAQVLDDPHLVAGIEDVRSIAISATSKIYAFRFIEFVAYSVTDEMYVGRTQEEEVFEGGDRVRVYSESHFLNHVSKTTWAKDEFPGPLLHIQLNTLDHTIDVVTIKAPEIRRFEADAMK